MTQQIELKENKNYILYSDGRMYSKRNKIFLKPQKPNRSVNDSYMWGKPTYPKYKINGKMMSIHRLLAKYFIPNPKKKPYVLHLDDDIYNWNLSNLCWGTASENMHMWVANRRKKLCLVD
ncbi:MAG: HNH endonuclease [Bacteroidetes bacterium]|nr:HNH endonuclease [Bacteroidota bacterium]